MADKPGRPFLPNVDCATYPAAVPDLDIRHLRYLIAVAEARSITRAAQRLMISQPALSRAIRALERAAGGPLLVRGSHATELTVAGKALLAEAYELVEHSRRALARARGARTHAETLTVAIAACDVVAVTAATRSFEKDHPGVRVDVVPREGPARPDELRAGKADVSFLRDCFDRHNLVVEELEVDPRVVLLPDSHPLATRDKLAITDLRDEPIGYWPHMSVEQADHWAGSDVDRRPRRYGPTVNSAVELAAAIVLGRAIGFAHGSTLTDTKIPGIRVLPVDGLSPSRLEIATSAHNTNSTANLFVEHVNKQWACP